MKNSKLLIALLLFCLTFLSCQDSLLEPENQFVQIYLKYNFKDKLNTFENTLEKDLVWDGVIKIRFWLTADEQNRILNKANSLNYFSMPDTFKYIHQDSLFVNINPNPGEQILRIKYQQQDKTTLWTYPPPENDLRFNDLIDIREFIIKMIESKPAYKRLPPRRGGYD